MKALSLQRDLAGIQDVVRGLALIVKGVFTLVRTILRAVFTAPQIGVQIEPGKIDYVRAARDRFPLL